MSSSSSRTRGSVLRDASGFARADLGTVRAAAARDLVVDPALVQQATEAGYRDGYAAGRDAGWEDAAAAIAANEHARGEQLQRALDRLVAETTTIADRHRSVIAEIEAEVVRIAFEIAREIVGHELRGTDHAARDALQRALRFAPPAGTVVAHLHPDDIAALGDAATAFGRDLTVVADDTLERGDAVVDVGPARIDARIQPALERIRAVLAS